MKKHIVTVAMLLSVGWAEDFTRHNQQQEQQLFRAQAQQRERNQIRALEQAERARAWRGQGQRPSSGLAEPLQGLQGLQGLDFSHAND